MQTVEVTNAPFAKIYSDRLDVVRLLVEKCGAIATPDTPSFWKIQLPDEWQVNFRQVLEEHNLGRGDWCPF